MLYMFTLYVNSLDNRVVRRFTSGAVDSGSIWNRVKPTDVKLVFAQLSYLTLSIKGTVWRTSRQVYLLCRWLRQLAGFSILVW